RRYHNLRDEHGRVLEQRASELEQFASRVAHDIVGPLSAIGLSFSLIERQAADQDQLRSALVRGQASVRRIQRITSGLLSFARAGARPEPGIRAEVRDTLEDVLNEVRPSAEE